MRPKEAVRWNMLANGNPFAEISQDDMSENALHKSILIVDDEEDLTWSISKSLAKNDKHFEVICVANGNAALEVLARRSIDVVISDIRMPGRNGLQLLHDINSRYAGTKVIIMTAHGSGDMREEIMAKGTPFYVEKPFEIRYLRKLIYEALDLTPPFAGSFLDSRNGIEAQPCSAGAF